MLRLHFALPILIASLVGGAHAADYTPPAASAEILKSINFGAAVPIDEDYRAQFKRCDDANVFRDRTLKGWRRCSTDKNNVRALLKLANGAIYFESKLGLDLDGSWKTWNDPGSADLRTTWYQWPKTCSAAERDSAGACQREQVDAEHVPFIVIPIAGPTTTLGKEFRNKAGIGKGDFEIIIYKDVWVPAFVADGGPFNKLGEASAAALVALGEDRCTKQNDAGFCTRYRDSSIASGVVTIVFPGSRRAGMTADTALAWMCEEAKNRLDLSGSPLCNE